MKIIIKLIIFIALCIILYLCIGYIFYNIAMKPKKTDIILKSQIKHSKLSIVSDDKPYLKLKANVYKNKKNSNKWAIVLHGYGANNATMDIYIKNFQDKGYNVLAPDLRAHGESEGEYISMGWYDRLDTLKWIDEIIKMDPSANIVIFGYSMGGATAMMVSGENLPKNVKVIIEQSGYTSVKDIFEYRLKETYKLPSFPTLNAASTMIKWRTGIDINEASSLKQVAKSKTPILFIHGDKDTFVPFKMLDEVYKSAKVEKKKLVIKGGTHGNTASVNPELYWNTVWEFVDRYVQQ